MPTSEPASHRFVVERKHVTVLFADIVGSTNLLKDLDAEASADRLAPALSAMTAAVRRLRGTVLHTLGDGLVAIFGAPHAEGEHALLACRAALALREAVAASDTTLQIRQGLASGEVVVGTFDGGAANELDAKGITVHLASRLEQMAAPGEICLNQVCSDLIDDYAAKDCLGFHMLKGFPEPIEVHRLLGLSALPRAGGRRGKRDRLDSRSFVGRNAQLAQLKQVLAAAQAGHGSAVGVRAPAGFGKSRLCFEFAELCRAQGFDVLEVRASPYGFATPFQPLLEMLRAQLDLRGSDSAQVRQEKVTQFLGTMAPAIGTAVTAALHFLGLACTTAPEVPRQPVEETFHELACMIASTLGQNPAVVTIEDLHWFDTASLELVRRLIADIHRTKVVLLMNYRPELPSSWAHGANFTEILLPELSNTEMDDLLSRLVGREPSSGDLRQALVMRCGGNPFFVEEMVHALAKAGSLTGESGRYVAVRTSQGLQLPASIEAVVASRIDSLSMEQKAALQAAAVIGDDAPLELLQRVGDYESGDLADITKALIEADFIRLTETTAGQGWRFRHSMIQEIAYGMQLRSRRLELHGSVAREIERFEWGKSDENAGLLAHHYESSGNPLSAIAHLQRAARWLADKSSSEAFRVWRTIFALSQMEAGSDLPRLRALAATQLLHYGWQQGLSVEEAKPYAEEALAYSRVHDQPHYPLVLGAYGRILAARRNADAYARLLRQGLGIAAFEREPAVFVTIKVMLAQAYGFAGFLRQSFGAGEEALLLLSRQSSADTERMFGFKIEHLLGFKLEHWARCLNARTIVRMGRLEEAEERLAGLIGAEHATTNPLVQFIPHLASIEVAWSRRDATGAEKHAVIVAEYAQQTRVPYLRAVALLCSGIAACMALRFDDAVGELSGALELCERLKAGAEFEPYMLAFLAAAHLGADECDAAAEGYRRGMAAARRRTDRVAEFQLCLLAQEIASRSSTLACRWDPSSLHARAQVLAAATSALPMFGVSRKFVASSDKR